MHLITVGHLQSIIKFNRHATDPLDQCLFMDQDIFLAAFTLPYPTANCFFFYTVSQKNDPTLKRYSSKLCGSI